MTMSDWLSPNPPRIANPFAVIKKKKTECLQNSKSLINKESFFNYDW